MRFDGVTITLLTISGLLLVLAALLAIKEQLAHLTEATRGVMRELHYIRRVLDKEDDYARF